MIISVPHSGTRSLMDYLETNDFAHFGDGIHFLADNADIPIRNPIKVALSWDARYSVNGSHQPRDMLTCFDEMLEYIHGRHPKVWRMEDYPVLPRSKGPERKPGPRVDAMKDWLKGDNLWFFQQYYDLEL